MTDHDAIAAQVRLMSEVCECDTDYCRHAEAHDDAPDYDGISAAYLDLYDEVKRLRAALDDIAATAFWIANDIHIGPEDEGRDIYDMALAIRDDARDALKGPDE